MIKLNRCYECIFILLLAVLVTNCSGHSDLNPVKRKSDLDPTTSKKINWDNVANTSTNALIAHFWNKKNNYWNVSRQKKKFAYWTGVHATDAIIAAYNRTGNLNYKGIIDDWYSSSDGDFC
jgi:hypothetical protein